MRRIKDCESTPRFTSAVPRSHSKQNNIYKLSMLTEMSPESSITKCERYLQDINNYNRSKYMDTLWHKMLNSDDSSQRKQNKIKKVFKDVKMSKSKSLKKNCAKCNDISKTIADFNESLILSKVQAIINALNNILSNKTNDDEEEIAFLNEILDVLDKYKNKKLNTTSKKNTDIFNQSSVSQNMDVKKKDCLRCNRCSKIVRSYTSLTGTDSDLFNSSSATTNVMDSGCNTSLEQKGSHSGKKNRSNISSMDSLEISLNYTGENKSMEDGGKKGFSKRLKNKIFNAFSTKLPTAISQVKNKSNRSFKRNNNFGEIFIQFFNKSESNTNELEISPVTLQNQTPTDDSKVKNSRKQNKTYKRHTLPQVDSKKKNSRKAKNPSQKHTLPQGKNKAMEGEVKRRFSERLRNQTPKAKTTIYDLYGAVLIRNVKSNQKLVEEIESRIHNRKRKSDELLMRQSVKRRRLYCDESWLTSISNS